MTIGPNPAPHFIWNASESVPIGLYSVQPARHLIVTYLVVAIPPEPLATFLAESGYLPPGAPLINRTLTLPEQIVWRTDLTITVDGIEIGTARERERRDRLLPVWQAAARCHTPKSFLMNWDEPASLDNRYFGPLPVHHRPRAVMDV